ncbi:hypothetical protein C8R41DRAFT_523360 [Lentinula lateritia]|uniref:N-terminal Ras-GEF domain-containing protein n=1 Tax=Lentinula lateritia TaxID=40482 RepID=A0ABQ8V6R2_9AGAR|nr:hypothetical protein C8R41DRAFT_523360 [Lentinula lateritia]
MALSYRMIFNVDVAPLNDKIVHSKFEESLTSCGSGLPETPTTAVPLPLHGRARSDSVNSLTGGGHNVYSKSSDVDVSLADEVDDAKGRGHVHFGSINTIGTTGTTETAIASGSGHSHLTTSSGGTFTGTLANSNAHTLPLSSTHSHNFSQGPDPSHKQLTPDSSFPLREPTSASSDSQQALLLAAQLQSALYPPPPEDPLDMVHRARDAVERVIVRLKSGSMGGGREENTSAMADLDTLIEDVVASVRGLLYVCGAGPSTTGGSAGGSRENGVIAAGGGGGLEALVPKIMVGITPTVASVSAASPSESSPLRIHTRTDSRSQSNPLKPSQRKLTATLSRLVLSARAIRYDSANASPESTIERIRGDVTELRRAIGAFGVEVQKVLDKLDRSNEDELYQRQINLNLTSNIDLAPMVLKLNLNPTLLSLAFEPTNSGLGMPTPQISQSSRNAKAKEKVRRCQSSLNHSKAILMTFKSFTSLNDLFDLLAERFRIQPPPGPATLQLRQWTSRKRNIVQFRVINTFKPMLTDEDIHEKEGFVRPRLNERIRVVGGGSSSYRIAVVVWR